MLRPNESVLRECITGLTFKAIVLVASLACVAFALCDVWAYDHALESRFVRFSAAASLFIAGSCGIGYVVAVKFRQAVAEELNKRQQAEAEVAHLRKESENARRNAGMAEFAAGVLHNVGNVLNSVNVSATCQSNLLMSSKLNQLERVVELLEKDDDELARFFARDDKGKQLPRYLRVLFDHLIEEKQLLFEHSQSLIKNVDHLKSIITTQQSYATSAGLLEPVEIETLFEDAINLHTESFTRHGIKVERSYAAIPPVLVDKQRVMQIVINLVKNAKEAMHGQKDGTKHLKLATRVDGDTLVLEVADSGMGISTANMGKMFSHGFTTKPSGHGFGLHSCANVAREMEGELTACSPGEDRGATLTLRLPFRAAVAHH